MVRNIAPFLRPCARRFRSCRWRWVDSQSRSEGGFIPGATGAARVPASDSDVDRVGSNHSASCPFSPLAISHSVGSQRSGRVFVPLKLMAVCCVRCPIVRRSQKPSLARSHSTRMEAPVRMWEAQNSLRAPDTHSGTTEGCNEGSTDTYHP